MYDNIKRMKINKWDFLSYKNKHLACIWSHKKCQQGIMQFTREITAHHLPDGINLVEKTKAHVII